MTKKESAEINELRNQMRKTAAGIDLRFNEIQTMQTEVIEKQKIIDQLENIAVKGRWCKMCARERTAHQSGICELCIKAHQENFKR